MATSSTELDESASYQYLSISEIQTSMDLKSEDYEYPIPQSQSEPPSRRSKDDQSNPVYENINSMANGAPPPANDSDSDYAERPQVVIKEAKRRSTYNGRELENSNKIYVEGRLEDYHSSFKSRSRCVSRAAELTSSLAEQGIYQGLRMTDQLKQKLGIMPESVYMATNLLENLGSEIELVNVADEDGEEELSAEERLRLVFKPKIRRPLRASAPAIQLSSSSPRAVVPRYRNYVIRPPPLPPIVPQATLAERKVYGVVESLLKSEASLLSSLQIAIQVYLKPLRELSLGPSPILNQQQVDQLFGPIEQILQAQELFYSALTSRTLAWHPEQKIGDVFLSSLATKEVIRQYSTYVNNFTPAIEVLEQGLKKPKFESFLREKYKQSNTSLSLQGLLLKPIQRYPQYMLFIQDMLKYTPPTHPDRITLQMALARCEGIADYLNESKRLTEQRSIVEYLNTRVSKLPFKLVDSQRRWLHRQDVVTRLFVSGPKRSLKRRYLLLFNNMVLCAASTKKKGRQNDLESTTGSRLFQAVEGSYTCKWYAPVDEFQILEPDYYNDVWDLFLETDIASANVDEYNHAKANHMKLEHDFNVMSRISSFVSKLHSEFEGLTMADVSAHIRVLQRKLAKAKEQIESHQEGRLDISIPSRDGSTRVHHTYVFPNKAVKNNWISTFRYIKLKLNKNNKEAWTTSEDTNDEDFFDLSHKLPLFVESYRLTMLHTLTSIQCATKVGNNSAWLASGNQKTAQITIIECVTPAPLVLESFKVESNRLIDIIYVPASAQGDSTLTATMRRRSIRDTLRNIGTLTTLPPHMATVWMGAECGRLIIYSAESIEDGSKKCLFSVKLGDAITSLQHYKNQVAVSTAEGNILLFQRNSKGWNMSQPKTISVSEEAIRCTCLVKNRMWIGINNICHFLNLQTHKLEGSLEMSDNRAVVSKMVCWGEGVWVSLKGSSSLELFHTVTKTSLQNIDVKASLNSIMKRRNLTDKYQFPDHVHVTALLVSSGYFWIGTSVGIIMVYRIPLIEGIPLVSAKPYLALDGHKGGVRVILTVETQATVSSTRVNQFLSAEQREIRRYSEFIEDGSTSMRPGQRISAGRGPRDQTDGESPSPEGSPAPVHILREEDPRQMPQSEENGELLQSGRFDPQRIAEDNTLVRSTTPSLPNPSTMQLEVSVNEDSDVELYTPPGSEDDVLEDSVDGETSQPAAVGQSQVYQSDSTGTAAEQAEMIPVTGIEESLDWDGPRPEEHASTSFLNRKPLIPETQIDDSLDFLGDGPVDPEEEDQTPTQLHAPASFPPTKEPSQEQATNQASPVVKEPSRKQATTQASPSYPQSKEPSQDQAISSQLPPSEERQQSLSEDTPIGTNHQPIIHHIEDLDESTGSADYAPILKANLLSVGRKPNTSSVLRRHRGKDIYLDGSESFEGYNDPVELGGYNDSEVDGYNDPTELDAYTFRRVPSNEVAQKMKEAGKSDSETDLDHSGVGLRRSRKKVPSPYEDPATLEHGGPIPADQLFSATLTRNTQTTVPGRPKTSKEGAVFVLTCGRGLIDLRHGARTSVLFPRMRARSSGSSYEAQQEEACVLSYELEQ